MLKLGYFLSVSLTLSIILTACVPATTPAPITIPPTRQPTRPPATLAPTPESMDVAMPVIEYKDDRNQLIVVSSVTGETFKAFAPIQLGQSYSYTFSTDKQTLALVSNGQLYLIDLPSWTYRTFDVNLNGWLWLSSVVYSPDESLLVLADGEPDGGLRVVDAKSGEVRASAQTGFAIRNVKFTTDGKAFMVYGPQLASTGDAANAGVSVGAPKATLFAVSDLSVLWSVELAGIRDGTFPKKADTANTQDIYQPGAAWHFEPGIAFAPHSDILYLVHGDEDKLTKVDFADRELSTVDVHVKASWFDQLLALTAGVAYAKGMDGTTKQAVISPDGKFLFVSGNTEVVTQQADGNDWDITDTSIGLQVIAVEDGTLVDTIDTGETSLQLSSDGRQIFLTGWKRLISYETPWTDIYDMSSNKLIKHIDKVSLTPTRLLNGKTIWVSNYAVSDNLCYMASVDSTTWTTVNEWRGKYCFGWLIDP